MANNSFAGTRRQIGNTGVFSVVSEILSYRTQITRTDEIRSVGGWSDPLNELLANYLGSTRRTLATVTDRPRAASGGAEDATDSSPGQALRQAEREQLAADRDKKLRELFGVAEPINTDDIQMPATATLELPYDFSGANPNLPQMSDPKYQNVFLIQFVTVMDMTVRDLTNLACSTYGNTIPPDQSAMIHSRLNQAFTILQTKGGRQNMVQIPNGTDPESLAGKVGVEVAPVVIIEPAPEVVGPDVRGPVGQ